MLILGIESTCDETALALVENGKVCLINLIQSQNKEHSPYKGIVPELASRAHLENINLLYENLIIDFEKKFPNKKFDFDCIAVSTQPGLIGSLMIGGSFAKCLSLVSKKPIIKVNHLEAHLYAPCLENWGVEYPFLGLLLSGGNTVIYKVEGPNNLKVLGDTLDDAIGEAFDKVSCILNLNSPDSLNGGPKVEQLAKKYEMSLSSNIKNKKKSLFKPLLIHELHNDHYLKFSYSGIKTAVSLAFKNKFDVSKICYDFQETAFELITRNLIKAINLTGIKVVSAGGGVFANKNLINKLNKISQEKNVKIVYPKNINFCTDNAAMVACLAYYLKNTSNLSLALNFDIDSQSNFY